MSFYQMHGRGMLLNAQTGELYEGWFQENELMSGRIIADFNYYVGSSIKKEGGICYLNYGIRQPGL